MSLFGNIGILGSALRNFETGLNVTSNNIANAATPGYSRTRLILQPLPPVADGSVQMGTGAFVAGVQRLRNIFLDNQLRMQLGDLGKAEARSVVLSDLASIFPEVASASATSGIQGALNDLTSKWSALATAAAAVPPVAATIAAAQTAVRDSLDTIAQRLNNDARLLFDAQKNVDVEVVNTVNQANTLLDQIASLNQSISLGQASAQGRDPNSLLDAREQAAEKLSELIGGNYRITADGSMTVTFSMGTLVDHNQVFHLKSIPSSSDPARSGVGYYDKFSNQYVDVTGQFTSGKLGGYIQTRDIDVDDARLALDKIAYGLIQRTNEINRTAIASDLTTNHQVFTGTKASDISLDPLLRTKPSYVGTTRNINPVTGVPGDVATLQSKIQDILMFSAIQSSPFQNVGATAGTFVDPTVPIGTITASFATTPGTAPVGSKANEFVIVSGSNTADVTWDDGDSINDIIKQINIKGGGAIQATFDQTSKKMLVYSNAPMSTWDITGSFAKAMKLSSVVTSSAPINNSPLSSYNGAVAAQALNSTTNTLNLFTTVYPPLNPVANYQVKVDNSTINWQPVNNISTVLNAINTGTPAGTKVSQSFNPFTQIVTLVRSGDPIFNPGNLTVAVPMTSITIADIKGNLTRVLNFDTNETANNIMSETVSSITSHLSSVGVLKSQAQALVDSTNQLQSEQSAVNLDEEIAQAQIFQRSYEASVRLQTIMDEMLNVLINHTGSSASGSSSSF